MEQVIGVRFKPAGKIYYFDSNNLDIHLDDGVIVKRPGARNTGMPSFSRRTRKSRAMIP